MRQTRIKAVLTARVASLPGLKTLGFPHHPALSYDWYSKLALVYTRRISDIAGYKAVLHRLYYS